MNKTRRMALVAVMAVALIGVGIATVNAFRGDAYTALTEENKEYKVTLDSTAFIQLPENMTTGYSWHYTLDGEDVLVCARDEHVASTSTAVGAAGQRELEFKAVGKGSVTITVQYYRTWEGVQSAIDSKTYKVTVR
ncbi:MAG TPA: protease inhibitor I42 family protein [Bacillota bacterium]|nr:protease inhibitor I42 family protein [Bacillota bacterium]